MNLEKNPKISESRVYVAKHKPLNNMPYKVKNPHLKCSYCDTVGHVEEKCWILHLELKPKFNMDHKIIPSRPSSAGSYKPQHAANYSYILFTDGIQDFTSNPVSLINEFAIYL
ncbi:hypothetical protein ACFX1Z_007093 [Malus domestica]